MLKWVLGAFILAQGLSYSLLAYSEPAIGDAARGRILVKQCRTCHGLDGKARIPLAPHIGGEPASYIDRQLRAFREGERSHEMMNVIAKGLSDQQIADLAAWYSSVEISLKPSGRNLEEAPGACIACHGAAGIAEMDDVPHLAGESVIYLDVQLKAFRDGKRFHDIMSAVTEGMSDEDIRRFAKWYSAAKIKMKIQK